MLEDCKEGGWGVVCDKPKTVYLGGNEEEPKGHIRYRRVGMGKDHGAAGKRDQYKVA